MNQIQKAENKHKDAGPSLFVQKSDPADNAGNRDHHHKKEQDSHNGVRKHKRSHRPSGNKAMEPSRPSNEKPPDKPSQKVQTAVHTLL